MNTNDNIELRTSVDAVAGMFVHVPVDARLVCENMITGKIKIKQSGLQFMMPWNKKTLVCIGHASFSCDFDDTLNNSEGWELTVKPVVVTYHIRKGKKTSETKTGIEKFYEQKEAIDRVKESMKSLVVTIVNNSTYNKLKGLELNMEVLKDKRKQHNINELEFQILSRISNMSEKYGIEIDSIKFGDVNKPKEITDAMAQKERQRIENETNLAKAKNDNEIAKLNAEANAIVARVDYAVLYDFAKNANLNSEQITDILKRQFTKSNSTIIEGGLSLEKLLAVALGRFNEYAQQQNLNNKGKYDYTNSEIIDTPYEEANDNNIPRIGK